jgi:hypothetical protein
LIALLTGKPHLLMLAALQENSMTIRHFTLVLAALVLGGQAVAQQNAPASRSPASTRPGWPAASLIGTPVYFKGGDQIGMVADVLVSENGNASLKLDVSGSIGQGRSVVIRFEEIEFAEDHDAAGRVGRFAPTDRSGGARLVDPNIAAPSAPPAATSPSTRAATNRTVDVEVPASIGAEPGSARQSDPRGADSMADVRSRSPASNYVGAAPNIGIWGGPSRALILLTREELIARSQ